MWTSSRGASGMRVKPEIKLIPWSSKRLSRISRSRPRMRSKSGKGSSKSMRNIFSCYKVSKGIISRSAFKQKRIFVSWREKTNFLLSKSMNSNDSYHKPITPKEINRSLLNLYKLTKSRPHPTLRAPFFPLNSTPQPSTSIWNKKSTRFPTAYRSPKLTKTAACSDQRLSRIS